MREAVIHCKIPDELYSLFKGEFKGISVHGENILHVTVNVNDGAMEHYFKNMVLAAIEQKRNPPNMGYNELHPIDGFDH